MTRGVRDTVRACREDMRYRSEVTLLINLAVNCAYAVFSAVCGFVLHSAWMGTLAFYYIILSLLRFFVLRGQRQEDLMRKWRTYRVCGGVMLALAIALAGMYILTATGAHAITYPWYFIYAVAAYTFYAAVIAVRNVIRCHRLGDPLLSAGKAISLAAAAVSIYSLQSALITAFGENDPEQFRAVMGNSTAAGVFAIIAAISLTMLLRGRRALKKVSA